jgi:hypothetical protein
MARIENDRIVETAKEARGGVTGHGVRGMVVWGITAGVMLFAAGYLYFFA